MPVRMDAAEAGEELRQDIAEAVTVADQAGDSLLAPLLRMEAGPHIHRPRLAEQLRQEAQAARRTRTTA